MKDKNKKVLSFAEFKSKAKTKQEPKKHPIKESKDQEADVKDDEDVITAEEFNDLLTQFVDHVLAEVEEEGDELDIKPIVEKIKLYMQKNQMYVTKEEEESKPDDESSKEEKNEEVVDDEITDDMITNE